MGTPTQPAEQLTFKTQKGNEMLVTLDQGHVSQVVAIDNHTGHVLTLSDKCAENVFRALLAKNMCEQIGNEVQTIQGMIGRFPESIRNVDAKGNANPAIKPYMDELHIAEKTYREMMHRQEHFINSAMRTADIAVAHDEHSNEGHGLGTQFIDKNSGVRQV